MNNDTYRTLRKEDEGEKAQDKATRLAVSLDRLIRNRDWKVVVEELLVPRLAGARERADSQEGAELHRNQGEIRVLKFLVNLPAALIAQQKTEDHETEENEGIPPG